MTNEAVTFPNLRALMAKQGMNIGKMSEVIGNNYPTFSRKLNGVSEFTFSDMLAIKDFFASRDEPVTIEYIFFDWKFTIVNGQVVGGENCGATQS